MTAEDKAGSKVMEFTKAAKSGSFSVKIANQKAGKILYVYAKDNAAPGSQQK
ncbi:hypothetical protein M3205_08115 [Cytobacillus firmus]|uniref:hypothetical protein n=1 Tax=Cytobacillus firmus TaxID=1399 RepID=UPI00203D9A77|nr:hypothetical protein [Cytobacillus firmus]MCM3705698.1 hypothetical protein [Cytobacillus firmus]